jgi:hypothetical protein
MANRLLAMGQPNYASGFGLAMHESALELPLRWKKPHQSQVLHLGPGDREAAGLRRSKI